ncbi:MAG: 2-amino-4-oxopentanoate thiolase subunit OrtA [Eubacteriales bacterium]|nr:2-amino-4-oxopentanoate thiolase subunit OrtA [Eubacteriales bacterium]
MRNYKAGDLVVIERVILPAGERAPSVPEETAGKPLMAYYKGYLKEAAKTGDEVSIETVIGREITGRLSNREVSYRHNFGTVVPELAELARSVRELVREEA